IDASFSAHRNRVGFGICIRDDECHFVLAKTMWSSPMCSVDLGEALGLYHALNWLHQAAMQNILQSSTPVEERHFLIPFYECISECIKSKVHFALPLLTGKDSVMDKEFQNAPEKSAVDKFQLIPEFLKVRELVKQHVDSFNYFVETDIKKIV
ncbi:DNA-directed RNA polymerase iii subunit rpc2-like protein, partial [Trifolium pratense]